MNCETQPLSMREELMQADKANFSGNCNWQERYNQALYQSGEHSGIRPNTICLDLTSRIPYKIGLPSCSSNAPLHFHFLSGDLQLQHQLMWGDTINSPKNHS
ncbi:Hypothetical predicted protein [Olea europaea subsp. europaea]|uniref:Uncharacterized protein n=1 Tax=Olea europaea subsp. europaea TaxID=158383 RepID=A0A8S0V762_OLEEU|nr:Hypothetical predicted protein [Olea europaea subsp. europaea]